VKRRSTAVAAFAVATVAVLGGCTSQPSAKAVAIDIVEKLDGLTEAQRACMLEKLEAYPSDELQQIGEANEGIGATSQGNEQLQEFEEDLNACMTEG
jgi:hypothetical protein